jgi:serralysin
MAVTNIKSQTQTVELSGDGSRWQVGNGVSIKAPDGDAVYNPFAENISLRIAGKVAATGAGTVSGFETLADGTGLVVAATGIVRGYFGLALHGDQAGIVNDGKILGTSPTGIGIVGGGDGFLIENTGLVKGSAGVDLNGHGRLVNEKGGEIEGKLAVRFNTSLDTEMINRGKLSGEDWSFIGGSGDDRLVNRGRMTGAVDMGDGHDRIDLRGGRADDGVLGGKGNDVFLVDAGKLGVREYAGEGYDMIWTTVSFALPPSEYAEFEFLGAKGKGDIALTGNLYDNTLGGNAGRNRLSGGGGEDIFYSGAGRDRLTGGAGGDVFVFRKGDDRDTITDFALSGSDHDTVDLHLLKAFKSIDDVLAAAKDTDAGVLLKLGKGDGLILEDVSVADLGTQHFDFAI